LPKIFSKLQEDTKIEYENVLAQFHSAVKLSITLVPLPRLQEDVNDSDAETDGSDNADYDGPRIFLLKESDCDKYWTETESDADD